MKKNILFLMCGLLSFAMLFTACSEDEPIVPEFPSEIQTPSMESNGSQTITITPNVKWALELSNKTDFYIKDGEAKVYTMQGQPGEYTITIFAEQFVDFDADRTCDVNLTMGGQTKTVATVTVEKIAREVKVYPAKVNNYGSFVKEAGKYVYAEEAVDAVSFVDVWGDFLAPVKVVSNFAFSVVGPEWMAAANGGEANTAVELVFTADSNNLPSADTTADVKFIDAGNEEKIGATITLSIAGTSKVMSAAFDEVFFTFDGEDEPATGYIRSDKDVQIVAIATDGSQASWITIEDSWDAEGTSIQEREVSISASANEGAAARVAYVFAIPAAVTVENLADLVVEGQVNEAYADYFVTTVTQHSQPATISAGYVDTECTTFAEAGADVNFWFTEGALSDYQIGSKYDISYFGEWAEYASESSNFKSSRPIESYEVFAYNLAGNFVNITESSWVNVDVFYTSEDGVSSFKLVTDLTAASAEESVGPTGEYEAVVLVKYNDGTCSAIYFHYSNNAGGGGNDSGAPQFYMDYGAEMDGTYLMQLTEGDIYQKYSEFGVPVYALIYTQPNPTMSMFKNLPMRCEPLDEAAWLTYEYGMEFQSIRMAESGIGQTAALLFIDEAENLLYVIVCQLMM
ncbi:MAG: hypothetical protein J6Q31_06780 [Alistipes sp.]|nr:hypothetical protein [Alistipes sp.]